VEERKALDAKTMGLSGRYGSVMTKERWAACNVAMSLKSVVDWWKGGKKVGESEGCHQLEI
jgi:hypothetical protein